MAFVQESLCGASGFVTFKASRDAVPWLWQTGCGLSIKPLEWWLVASWMAVGDQGMTHFRTHQVFEASLKNLYEAVQPICRAPKSTNFEHCTFANVVQCICTCISSSNWNVCFLFYERFFGPTNDQAVKMQCLWPGRGKWQLRLTVGHAKRYQKTHLQYKPHTATKGSEFFARHTATELIRDMPLISRGLLILCMIVG